jgi:hypothetical protein
MPVPYFEPGLGPDPLEKGDTKTFFAPSDTNSTTNVITAGMPLLKPDPPNAYAVSRPANNAVPELISTQRQDQPNGPVGCRMIGAAAVGAPPAGNFVEDVPYFGAVPGGNDLQVLCDGAGAFKIVAAGAGVGKVLKAAGGRALVQF